ncbi:MAG: STAS-like domain-containing protein [Halomonas sp.]|nr:STAS-like domain-containing protein [Halomonas sp.]MDP3534886.1 STAS-like domain-containing protein [Halomonas sp.]
MLTKNMPYYRVIVMKVINIAKDFSPFPAGREIVEGPFSGEAFRIDHLMPALDSGEKVKIIFDGGFGYGSSFLEESFGGLIRTQRYNNQDILKKMVFVSEEDPFLISEIESYVKDAIQESKNA